MIAMLLRIQLIKQIWSNTNDNTNDNNNDDNNNDNDNNSTTTNNSTDSNNDTTTNDDNHNNDNSNHPVPVPLSVPASASVADLSATAADHVVILALLVWASLVDGDNTGYAYCVYTMCRTTHMLA